MMDLSKQNLGQDEDWYGNNAAVRCPGCGKVFLSSQVLHRKGRACPQCGRFKLTVGKAAVRLESVD